MDRQKVAGELVCSNLTPVKEEKGMNKEVIQLQVEELEERIAPSIVLENPAGNTPQGGGANNGQAIENVNPSGYAPPGQNK